jgi:dipeptidyl-peptidase-4
MLFRSYRLVLACLLPLSAFAQSKVFTFEDAVTNSALNPLTLRQLSWIPATDQFAFVIKVKNTDYLVRATDAKRDTITSVPALSTAVQAVGAEKLSAFPVLTWNTPTTFTFMSGPAIYRYDVVSKKAEKLAALDAQAENQDMDVRKLSVAYTKGNNLYIAKKGGETVQVTKDEKAGIINGQAAHRSEFGITKGTFWSPTGAALAFYHQDETMVTDYPLVDISTLPAHTNPIKYPMAGGKSHHTTVGIYKTWDKSTVYLKTGEPAEQYLTNITWSPDEKFVFVAVVNRGQNEMKLNQYEASTGTFIKTLLTEKNEKWIEPEHGPVFLTGKADEFLWFSKRDGWQHLYHYDLKGTLKGQVTKGEWTVTELLGMSPDAKTLYIMTTAASPIERQAYSVSIKGGEPVRLTQARGTHTVLLSPKSNYLLDSYSSTTVPREVSHLDVKGKLVQPLVKADNPLKDYKLGEMTLGTLKAADGTDLYYRIIKPIDFDPKKKYPVIVYQYGGSHAQLVTDSWGGGADRWFQLMAQKGYVMFTLDTHGSPARGLKFEQATHRQLGTVELTDQLKGVEFLKSQPWVDASRMGIYGWSYGGFMTTNMMLTHPDVFKTAVAGGPVMDWKLYEIMYTERYMDTPQENPEGYARTTLFDRVKDLKGKLLLIHGTVDDVVVWQHSLSFLKKAVDENVLLDYFVYPGHPHNVRGKDRVHLMRKITQYFEDYLKG